MRGWQYGSMPKRRTDEVMFEVKSQAWETEGEKKSSHSTVKLHCFERIRGCPYMIYLVVCSLLLLYFPFNLVYSVRAYK